MLDGIHRAEKIIIRVADHVMSCMSAASCQTWSPMLSACREFEVLTYVSVVCVRGLRRRSTFTLGGGSLSSLLGSRSRCLGCVLGPVSSLPLPPRKGWHGLPYCDSNQSAMASSLRDPVRRLPWGERCIICRWLWLEKTLCVYCSLRTNPKQGSCAD